MENICRPAVCSVGSIVNVCKSIERQDISASTLDIGGIAILGVSSFKSDDIKGVMHLLGGAITHVDLTLNMRKHNCTAKLKSGPFPLVQLTKLFPLLSGISTMIDGIDNADLHSYQHTMLKVRRALSEGGQLLKGMPKEEQVECEIQGRLAPTSEGLTIRCLVEGGQVKVVFDDQEGLHHEIFCTTPGLQAAHTLLRQALLATNKLLEQLQAAAGDRE